MANPRILVFSGSIRTGSFNAKLAAAAAREIAAQNADVTLISLADYELPIYNGDLEAEKGVPENARKLKRQFMSHEGVFIATPEYNASFTPLLKNTLDWVSRREGNEAPLAAYKDRVFALGAASNSPRGGYRSLTSLRMSMELGMSALVIPEMVSVPVAASAFAEDGALTAENPAQMLKTVASRLVALARRFAA
jgi:chromate reductase